MGEGEGSARVAAAAAAVAASAATAAVAAASGGRDRQYVPGIGLEIPCSPDGWGVGAAAVVTRRRSSMDGRSVDAFGSVVSTAVKTLHGVFRHLS